MNEKILITGGGGFMGHALVEYLLTNTTYDLITLDRLDASGTLNRLGHVLQENPHWKSRITVVWHDLKAPLNDYTMDRIGSVDYILHLAAGSHVDRSVQYPMAFVMDNVVGTCNLLDYARLHCDRLKLFLYFSTDEVFGPAPEGTFFKENDRYNSGNPYSASKAGAEELCVAFENTYKLPIIITHTMNIYGPKQHPEKFIPLVINKVLNDEEVHIHSNKELTEAGKRHYLYSEDVSKAIMFLLSNHTIGEKYNIVANEETDNLDLARRLADIIGKPLKYKLVDPTKTRPRFDFRYAMCGKKMHDMGWSQEISLTDGLAMTVDWYIKQFEIHTKNSMQSM